MHSDLFYAQLGEGMGTMLIEIVLCADTIWAS